MNIPDILKNNISIKYFDIIIPSKNIIIFKKKKINIPKHLNFFIEKKISFKFFKYNISQKKLIFYKKVYSNLYQLFDLYLYKIKNYFILNRLFKNEKKYEYDFIIYFCNYKIISFDLKNFLVKKIFLNDFETKNMYLIYELQKSMKTSFIKLEKKTIYENYIEGEPLIKSKNINCFIKSIYDNLISRNLKNFKNINELCTLSEEFISIMSSEKKNLMFCQSLHNNFKNNLYNFSYVVSYTDCSLHNVIVKNDQLYYIDIIPRKIDIAPSFYEFFCLIISSKIEYNYDFDFDLISEISDNFFKKIFKNNFSTSNLNDFYYSTFVFMIYFKKINLQSSKNWFLNIFK